MRTTNVIPPARLQHLIALFPLAGGFAYQVTCLTAYSGQGPPGWAIERMLHAYCSEHPALDPETADALFQVSPEYWQRFGFSPVPSVIEFFDRATPGG